MSDDGAQFDLSDLGWQAFFATQTDVEEMAALPPVRVMQVNRTGLTVQGATILAEIPTGPDATVGDWLMYDAARPGESRVLERKSVIKRRAAGHDRAVQLIAANLDTGFIVTSCNADFNIARLERYIALVLEARVTPVIVLTKPDLSDGAEDYLEQARAISELVDVVMLDARGTEALAALAAWCRRGQTVAFLGSSGVGKSTLVNALSEGGTIRTQGIREADARGRHTTTRRQLHITPGGCAVLDTPGMRELQLTDVAAGVDELFADLSDIAAGCKFRDCAHESEPGCAVLAAVDAGQLNAQRVRRWKKLVAEDAFNSATLAERRHAGKAFTKRVKAAKSREKR